MNARILKRAVAPLSLIILTLGCVHVNYIGKTLPPTSDIDVYYSDKEIIKGYTVIGHAIGGGKLFVSMEKIQDKLIKEAQLKGADAILFTGVGRDNVENAEGFDAEKQVKASFLKYADR